MAESATEKILRLSGKPVPHGADVAHNAAVLAVMGDKSGTANHSTRDGHVVHSVKNSDAVVVMSHHPEHSSYPGRAAAAAPAATAKLTASEDGSPSDGLVAHGILRKSELPRGSSAIQAVRDMVAADDDPDNEGATGTSGHADGKDLQKDLKELDKALGGVKAKEGDKK